MRNLAESFFGGLSQTGRGGRARSVRRGIPCRRLVVLALLGIVGIPTDSNEVSMGGEKLPLVGCVGESRRFERSERVGERLASLGQVARVEEEYAPRHSNVARGIAHAACALGARLTMTLTLILSLAGRGLVRVPKESPLTRPTGAL